MIEDRCRGARACLVMVISAVGLKTSVAEMTKVGPRAMILLVVETLFLALFILTTQMM